MALISFKIAPTKAISLAECTSIPRVMIIAGPNGSGKSTLLYEVSQKRGVISDTETKIIYQPPHRAIRRTTIRRGWLGGATKSIMDLFSGTDVSGYEGLSFQNSARTPDNVDEAGSTIKHTLGKIENKRQAMIAELFDRNKKKNKPVDTASSPDIYLPLKELTKYLLPHLIFDRVDFKNEEIAFRIMRKLKSHTARVFGITKEELKKKLETEINEVKKLLPEDEHLDILISEVNNEVEKIISDGNTLKYFRGKNIMKKIYGDFIQPKNISYSRFCYELAEVVAKKATINKLLNPIFDQIENINPE